MANGSAMFLLGCIIPPVGDEIEGRRASGRAPPNGGSRGVIPGRVGGILWGGGNIGEEGCLGDSPLSEPLSCVSSSVVASGETFFIAAFPLLGPLPLSSSGTGGCLPKGAGAKAGAAGAVEPSEGSLAGRSAPGMTTPDPAESEEPRTLRAAPPRLPFNGGSMTRGGSRLGERASGGSPWEMD